jgi:hypothetical protein
MGLMRVVGIFPRPLGRLLVTLACAAGILQGQGAEAPLQITFPDLAANPRKFDGQLVRVRALPVYGFEGMTFCPIRRLQTHAQHTFGCFGNLSMKGI